MSLARLCAYAYIQRRVIRGGAYSKAVHYALIQRQFAQAVSSKWLRLTVLRLTVLLLTVLLLKVLLLKCVL
jgi:hypothetical protein